MPNHPASLSAKRIVSFQSVQGTRLHILEGCVWVTQTHDQQDHFLHAQQSLELRSGHVVIEADEDSQYTLELSSSITLSPQSSPLFWRAH